MIILEVAFVLVNLAVPYWIWTSKSTNNLPTVEREAFRKRLFEISEASGGFAPCKTIEVVETIDELCQKSRAKFTDKESMAFERAGADVVFSCEVRKDSLKVQWFPERDSEPDLNCEADRDEMMAYAPTFIFNLKGQIRQIEYSTPAGGRQTAPMQNCRRKLKTVKAMGGGPPTTRAEFIRRLGHLVNDPPDWQTENLMCLGYDPHPDWEPWRRRYGL
jgi:hypothetical protein